MGEGGRGEFHLEHEGGMGKGEGKERGRGRGEEFHIEHEGWMGMGRREGRGGREVLHFCQVGVRGLEETWGGVCGGEGIEKGKRVEG